MQNIFFQQYTILEDWNTLTNFYLYNSTEDSE